MNSKKLLLSFLTFLSITWVSYSQDTNTRKNCFDDYNYMFTTRGTIPVPDGMHKVSVAVVSAAGKANCLVGQILVKDGNIVLPLYIPREDGSMTETRGVLDNSFYRETSGQISYKVADAMSPVYYLEGKRKARMYFIDFLKPEPGKMIDAPVMNSHIKKDTTITRDEISKVSGYAQAIQFETGKAVIIPASYSSLDLIAEVMKQHPDAAWLIDGYSDNSGNAKSNIELSAKRANAVVNYFVRKGIKPDHLFGAGHGIDNPIADNNTAEGRAKNRRVEVKPLSD
ncbi:MAG: OmpA family protein [Chitinophagales bacterium]